MVSEQPAPPQHCPSPRELDDLELLTHGALAPLTGFDGPDGRVTLTVPGPVAEQAECGRLPRCAGGDHEDDDHVSPSGGR
jgi:hypothetical protein